MLDGYLFIEENYLLLLEKVCKKLLFWSFFVISSVNFGMNFSINVTWFSHAFTVISNQI